MGEDCNHAMLSNDQRSDRRGEKKKWYYCTLYSIFQDPQFGLIKAYYNNRTEMAVQRMQMTLTVRCPGSILKLILALVQQQAFEGLKGEGAFLLISNHTVGVLHQERTELNSQRRWMNEAQSWERPHIFADTVEHIKNCTWPRQGPSQRSRMGQRCDELNSQWAKGKRRLAQKTK